MNVMSQLIALKEVEDLQQAREVVKRSFPTEEYLPEDTEQWDEAIRAIVPLLTVLFDTSHFLALANNGV